MKTVEESRGIRWEITHPDPGDLSGPGVQHPEFQLSGSVTSYALIIINIACPFGALLFPLLFANHPSLGLFSRLCLAQSLVGEDPPSLSGQCLVSP